MAIANRYKPNSYPRKPHKRYSLKMLKSTLAQLQAKI
jgi:hypothetical protein